MAALKLWCQVEGEKTVFRVKVNPNTRVCDLKKTVFKEGMSRTFLGIDAKDLCLWKVRSLC